MVLRHALHFQMPTDSRFTVSCAVQQLSSMSSRPVGCQRTLPQKVQVYRACWVISIFLICLRSEAPYRVPYLATGPPLTVLLACVVAEEHGQRERPDDKTEFEREPRVPRSTGTTSSLGSASPVERRADCSTSPPCHCPGGDGRG